MDWLLTSLNWTNSWKVIKVHLFTQPVAGLAGGIFCSAVTWPKWLSSHILFTFLSLWTPVRRFCEIIHPQCSIELHKVAYVALCLQHSPEIDALTHLSHVGMETENAADTWLAVLVLTREIISERLLPLVMSPESVISEVDRGPQFTDRIDTR